jgi:hypothetical protein
VAKPPKQAKGHPPCPTKFGPPPGQSKNDDKDQPCGKAKGKEKGKKDGDTGKGAGKDKGKDKQGGILLVLPMTALTAAYAVRPERLRPRRRAR